MKKLVLLVVISLLCIDVLACAAITKKGTQCKRAPSPGSIYCWQHGGATKTQQAISVPAPLKDQKSASIKDSKRTEQEGRKTSDIGMERVQCDAMTKKGTRCTRKSQPGGTKCWQHAK